MVGIGLDRDDESDARLEPQCLADADTRACAHSGTYSGSGTRAGSGTCSGARTRSDTGAHADTGTHADAEHHRHAQPHDRHIERYDDGHRQLWCCGECEHGERRD